VGRLKTTVYVSRKFAARVQLIPKLRKKRRWQTRLGLKTALKKTKMEGNARLGQ